VSEHLHRARRGVRGGVQGGLGAAPSIFFFRDDIFRDDIFPGRHIFGTT
jgi:hypothetical protein